MYPAGNLFIRTPHGRLEAILKEPKTKLTGAALVLHPHPLGGGTMHNKVVFRAAAALNDAGLVTLRVNFRSVGQSTGTHDQGRGEQDDARRALDYLAEHYPNQPITLAGFSFGSYVGIQAGIKDARVTNLISIGTPVDKYDLAFLEDCHKPILFVQGEHDEFGAVERLRALVDDLKASGNPEVQMAVIPGAGHFFDESLDELKRVITDWIKTKLPGALKKL